MASELTPTRRQTLKGRAHTLNPVVLIGAGGLTPAILAETRRALDSHELIKIRIMGADRHERDRLLGEICNATGAAPVQHIGKVIVIFRERDAEPPPTTPPRATKPTRKPKSRPFGAQARLSSRHRPSPRRGKLRPR